MAVFRKGGHQDLERYYPLLEMDFDSEELFGKRALHRGIGSGDLEYLILQDEETKLDLAHVLTIPRGVYGYTLLKYLGVFPWYRGKGIGVETMRKLHVRYQNRQGILAEITDFPDEDPDRQKKLDRFFRRFGYEEIPCDHRISGVRAHLMVKPLMGPGEIGPVADRILTDLYDRVPDKAALRRMFRAERMKTPQLIFPRQDPE